MPVSFTLGVTNKQSFPLTASKFQDSSRLRRITSQQILESKLKVYRGPLSKDFTDDSHEFVSKVSAQQLEEGISSRALIQFNITKDGVERHAVCTTQFEESDVIPMISGLLSRLKLSQECIRKIRTAMKDKEKSEKEKLLAIQAALSHL